MCIRDRIICVSFFTSCSITKELSENTINLQISNFEITKKTDYVITYQLDGKLSNFTKEDITILLPLQENDNQISQWHKPEFFAIKSTPYFGLEYLDGQPEHIHLKTEKELITILAGKSHSFKFYSNCNEVNNIDGAFKGPSTITLSYDFNQIIKESALKKLPKTYTSRNILDDLSTISIQSNALEVELN